MKGAVHKEHVATFSFPTLREAVQAKEQLHNQQLRLAPPRGLQLSTHSNNTENVKPTA